MFLCRLKSGATWLKPTLEATCQVAWLVVVLNLTGVGGVLRHVEYDLGFYMKKAMGQTFSLHFNILPTYLDYMPVSWQLQEVSVYYFWST